MDTLLRLIQYGCASAAILTATLLVAYLFVTYVAAPRVIQVGPATPSLALHAWRPLAYRDPGGATIWLVSDRDGTLFPPLLLATTSAVPTALPGGVMYPGGIPAVSPTPWSP